MPNGIKKSLYVYLSSLLGILLFLILHRIVVLIYLLLAGLGYSPFVNEVVSLQFLAFEYLTLILSMMLGAWYGIWVGMHWYEVVYERESHPGLVGHLSNKFWPKTKNRYKLGERIEEVQKKLQTDIWQFEDLVKAAPAAIVSPEPIKKKIVRKRAPRRLSKMA
jgi:hypothetical protein